MQHQPASRLRLFETTRKASFLTRRNRFVLECLLAGNKQPAYLPNPGRLRELLLPGRTIYLAKSSPGSKFKYTAVAVDRAGRPVMLHTHMANRVVEWLLREGIVPGFEGATITRTEATAGHSRFDFLLQHHGRPFLLEVKSCTLFEGSIAMFPDAVTARGRRHLLELAREAEGGTPGGVIILINRPGIRWFLPDYHTDLDFARAMLAVRNTIDFTPLSVTWNADLTLSSPPRAVAIPWTLLEREAGDSGSYILILRFDRDRSIEVGHRAAISFRRGYYLYVGSARANLTQRIDRHLRRRKNFYWHIDYLRDKADACTALPIRSGDSLECEIARALEPIADWAVPSFGSSDCRCNTHLFGMNDDPTHRETFVNLLQYFRISRLETMLESPEETGHDRRTSSAQQPGKR